uniref:Ribose 5-phosphate isomerase B n=1 Tax=candidate division WOR-3 bacterium TaxID=2052148 RepID=A0A7C4CBD5_UNCW3
MTIAVGADHRGFRLKEQLRQWLTRAGHRVIDKGTFSPERSDYPEFGFAVARAVQAGRAQRGILVCATGIGMCIAANRFSRVRAALCSSVRLARLAREHNDANVLCLGADTVSRPQAQRIVRVWLKSGFAGGRHRRRRNMLARPASG